MDITWSYGEHVSTAKFAVAAAQTSLRATVHEQWEASARAAGYTPLTPQALRRETVSDLWQQPDGTVSEMPVAGAEAAARRITVTGLVSGPDDPPADPPVEDGTTTP